MEAAYMNNHVVNASGVMEVELFVFCTHFIAILTNIDSVILESS